MTPKAPPSTRTPQAVPSGGNAKYAIVVLLLLGGIGGVVAWKSCSGPPEVAVNLPPPIPSFKPPPRPTDDDVPPPPPIVDSGPEAAPAKITYVPRNLCDEKCIGKTTSELETALAVRAKQAHRCYDTALAQDSSLKGKMTISVRVASNGASCSAGIASNDMGSVSVANCVANTFRNGAFPIPAGGCVDVQVPISFVPR